MNTTKIINFFYSAGAAVVIYGAWQKITHRPGADMFLTIGLITEVIIFTVTAVQELFTKQKPDVAHYPKIESVNNTDLTESVNNLNKTIKQIFNR